MTRPRVLLTELREYKSAKGSTYFAGYLGKARVVVLRDDRATITGKEVARWNVLLEEPEPREAGGRHPVRSERSASTRGSAHRPIAHPPRGRGAGSSARIHGDPSPS